MTVRGHVEAGHIILDNEAVLPDGAIVEVRVVESTKSATNGRESLLKLSGIIDDLPPDASANIDRILYGSPPK